VGLRGTSLAGISLHHALFSPGSIWSVPVVVGDACRDLAPLIEHFPVIELRKHSAKSPRIRPDRLPEGNNCARADCVCWLKYWFRPSRSCSRARHSRAFTAV